MIVTGKNEKYSEKTLYQGQFAHHEFHKNWSPIERWPRRGLSAVIT